MIIFILGFSIGFIIGMVIMYLDLKQDLQDLDYWKNHRIGPSDKEG